MSLKLQSQAVLSSFFHSSILLSSFLLKQICKEVEYMLFIFSMCLLIEYLSHFLILQDSDLPGSSVFLSTAPNRVELCLWNEDYCDDHKEILPNFYQRLQ